MSNVPTLTASLIALMCGVSASNRFSANAAALIAGLEARAVGAKLNEPQNLAQFLAQVAHESGRFMFDEEAWGPTIAQLRYDVRTDLGNTAAVDGDGKLFKGRTAIMVTGGHNYRAFRDWCRGIFGAGEVPDFEVEPERILDDPWEGLAPIWFWETNGLDRYARAGDIEMVTKTINGGLNGYADRLALYPRCALVLLGHQPDAVRSFQRSQQLAVDGIAGPQTRAALHGALSKMPPTPQFAAPTLVNGASTLDALQPKEKARPVHEVLTAPEALGAMRVILSRYDQSKTAKGATS